MARFVRLKDVKLHDLFLIPTSEEKRFFVEGDVFDLFVSESRVRVRGRYDRSSKKYSCCHYLSKKYSCCHYLSVVREFFKNGNTLVIVDFDF